MKLSLLASASSRRCAVVTLTALAVLTFAAPVAAQLPAPQLASLVPPGVKAGSTLTVTATGTDLDEAYTIVFSHPAIQTIVKTSPATEFEKAKPQPGVFEVQVPADVAPGTYEARVVGRFGVSNPRAFVVGVYDEANEPGGNNQPDKAAPVKLDTTINGVVDSNQVDYFKLPLKANQRVLMTCQAYSIDSRLAATMVLFSPSGKELDRNHAPGADALIDFTAPADGEYRLAVHDFTYRGGSEFFYRFTLDVGPHIDFVVPPAGVPGSSDAYTIFGRNLPGGVAADGLMIDRVPLQKLQVNIPLPGDENSRRTLDAASFVSSVSGSLDGISYRLGNSNPVLISYAKAPIVAEVEPNNSAAQAQTVSFPTEAVGHFYPARDVDYFTFPATKGQTYNIEVISHQLGLPVDPILVIQKVKKNEKGEEVIQDVAQVDDPNDRNNRIGSEFDTSTDDPSYNLTADEDVLYRLMVRDQFGTARNDPRMQYRLVIHQGQPDFRLTVVAAPVVAPANPNAVQLGAASVRKGSTTSIDLRLDRRYGFAGDVEVAVEGLPTGVTCPAMTIGSNQSSGSLVITAADDAASWAGSVRIIGKAKIGDANIVRFARCGTAVWGTPNRQESRVPFRFTRDLVLAVTDRETLPALAQVGEDKLWETSRGGKLEIPIRVTRRGEFKEDLTFVASDLPNEVKPPNLLIKGGEAEGKLQLAVTNGNAKPGLYTFSLRADTKLKHTRNPEAVAAAEVEQKEIDAAIAMLTEKNKQATEMKNAAVAAAQAATDAAKQAEQEKVAAEAAAKQGAETLAQLTAAVEAARQAAAKDGGNATLTEAVAAAEKVRVEAEATKAAAEAKLAESQKKLADSQAAAKSAEDAKAAAEKAFTEVDAKLKAAQQVKPAVDKRLNDAKAANNPKDLQFALISTPIKLRIVESCLEVMPGAEAANVKQAEKVELLVKVNRLYGFDDQVEVTLDVPSSIPGVSANKITIAKGQPEGKLEIMTTKDSPVGEHPLQLKAKARFNNIESQANRTVTLKIEPAAQ